MTSAIRLSAMQESAVYKMPYRNSADLTTTSNLSKSWPSLKGHYPEFPGLNLTWETLEGTVKHNGPIKKVTNDYLKNFNKQYDLDLKNYPSMEGQVGAAADDIAYNNHDIDDGFNAGFFTISQLRGCRLLTRFLLILKKQSRE